MNLAKLFEVQKVLRDRINYNEPDRFNKLVLALLVELGECANEWRGFKFWSKDQKPNTSTSTICGCVMCEHHYVPNNKNPLLEEFVDGLHFVLELGIELGFENTVPYKLTFINSPMDLFRIVYKCAIDVEIHRSLPDYRRLISEYVSLGEHLGFTWDQIEQAYMEKNAVNHIRQSEGY